MPIQLNPTQSEFETSIPIRFNTQLKQLPQKFKIINENVVFKELLRILRILYTTFFNTVGNW